MDQPPSPVEFDADGLPRSRRFGDVYFSREGGLAESRAVFLAGCGLPARWAERRQFTVAELGFGTGLNILALLQLWRANRSAGGRLSIFSVEAEPVDAGDAARMLQIWPELADVASPLLAAWPGRRSGFHRIELPDLHATLDLAVMDAEAGLRAWDGRADAWFLDGFAPAKNPGMWTPALMRLVAQRSAPGARAATYTVAGDVRRGLADAGFEVSRQPGFGRKRERLEASLMGEAAERRLPSIAIVGAGIAGAALARAFRALGVKARVFDAAGPGAGASGNPAAMVTPGLDAGLAAPARLYAQAFARAVSIYEAMDGVISSRGALQLEATPGDAVRFAKIAASDLFDPGSVTELDAARVGEGLGEPAAPGLLIRDGLVIEPARVLAAWLGEVEIARVSGVEAAGGGWRLTAEDGSLPAEAEVVVLACGMDVARLWPAPPLNPVRGQLSWSEASETAIAAAWGAYAAPRPGGGVVFGATNDRGDTSSAARPADNERNLAAVTQGLPALAARIAGLEIHGRASVRAATTDRFPLVGEAAPGLYLFGGFGSRGFTLAPLLAEHLAAEVLGAPSPLPTPLAKIIHLARFAERIARRQGTVAKPQIS